MVAALGGYDKGVALATEAGNSRGRIRIETGETYAETLPNNVVERIKQLGITRDLPGVKELKGVLGEKPEWAESTVVSGIVYPWGVINNNPRGMNEFFRRYLGLSGANRETRIGANKETRPGSTGSGGG